MKKNNINIRRDLRGDFFASQKNPPLNPIAHIFTIAFLLLFSYPNQAQELFPLAEPASTMPKNVLGVRAFTETYHEVNQWRNMTALRFLFGLTPKSSVYITGIASNHHGKKMPPEFPFHNTPERGAHYPYKFNGIHVYSKYRFLSKDGENTHLRMALYAEGSYVNTTHHESEPDLMMGDNSGIGAGWISTYLRNKFAASLTIGYIYPFGIHNVSPDPIAGLPDVPVYVDYGQTLTYSLSFGYLLFPKTYKDYKQLNMTFYLELKGKYFGDARVTMFEGLENEYHLHKTRYPPALQDGYFLDISPSVQFIINSNLRMDLSATFRGIGVSYARLYPVYTIGIQRYFYFK